MNTAVPHRPATGTELTRLLAGALRGSPDDLESLVRAEPARLDVALEHHGVLPLVAEQVLLRAPDSPLAIRLAPRLRQNATLDMFREADLCRALQAFADADIQPILMKGAALAYSYYQRPDLRPRLDSDLLVSESARPAADRVLRALGFARDTTVAGEFVSYQAAYFRELDGRIVHAIDLHWRVANPQVFAAVLHYDEALAAAVPIPALGPRARALGAVHALLIACTHRIAHHDNSDSLIWLYDIDLIARRFVPAEWEQFVALALSRGIAAVVRESLSCAVSWFDTPVPGPVLQRLDVGGAEDSALYLAPGRRHISHIVQDLRTLQSWSQRLRLMREHLLPSREYMRHVYAPASEAPLSFLYAIRMWRGARRWLAPRGRHV